MRSERLLASTKPNGTTPTEPSKRGPIWPSQVQHAKPRVPVTELRGEAEHVDRGPAEPVKGGDDQRVTVMQRVQRAVERRTRGTGTGHTVVDVEVIATDTCGE